MALMRARYLFREFIAELDDSGRYGTIFGTKASLFLSLPITRIYLVNCSQKPAQRKNFL